MHKQSNHPPNIIKRIPTIINQRLSKLSCCEEDFNNCKEQYQEALKKSGHNTELKFTKEEENQHTEENRNRQKKRKRKITWFNPPYAANLKTNIGKHFLALIDKHFNSSNPLHKIFNRKTIKLSYSCTPNMRAIIQQHNMKIATKNENQTKEGKNCNCRKMPCPLSGNCLSECVVYEATIAHGGTETKYYGSTGNTFKERYRNHLSSFKLSHKSNETTLSTFVWDNGLNPTPEVRWRIIGKRRKVQPNGLCGVCNLEKLTILKSGPNTLNKRDEILRKCPHRDKNSLAKC